MIPVKLTMHAFGPFAREQEIDFSRMGNRRIFLITGETGAGKTTIFDAVAFALYGNASGESRKAYTLKSHHASETDLCWVRFCFSLREQTYEVYRQPLQPGRKRDGTPKELGEKAELLLPGGQVLTGSTAVNRRVGEILGLNYQQFKQTIMLAQGEFRQLLEASSSQKQEIFSKIFGTDSYRFLSDALTARQTDLGRQVQSFQQAISRGIQELGRLGFTALAEEDAQYLTLEALSRTVDDGLSLHREQLEQLNRDIAALEAERAQIRLEQAKELNEKLDRYQALRDKAAQLEQQREHMTAVEAATRRLLAARELREQEEIILSTKKNREETHARGEALRIRVADLRKDLADANARYEALPQRKESLAKGMEELAALREQRKALAVREQQLAAISTREAQLSRRLERLEARELAVRVSGCRRQIRELEQTQKATASLMEELDRSRELTLQLDQARKDYQTAYRAFVDGQAARLAQELNDDSPCPVCGSPHHPAPAKAPPGGTGTESAVNRAREALDRLQARHAACSLSVSQLRDALAALSDGESPSGEDAPSSLPAIRERLAHLQEQLGELMQQAGLLPHPFTEADVGDLADGEAISAEKAGIAADREAVATLQNTVASTSESPDIKNIPSRISELQNSADTINKEIQQTEQHYLSIRSQYDQVSAEQKATESHAGELAAQFSRLRAQFIEKLRDLGFSGYKDYSAAVESLGETDTLLQQLEHWKRDRTDTVAALEALAPDVAGRSRADLPGLTARSEELTRRIATSRETATELYALITAATGRMDELGRLYAESGERAREYAIAADLAALAKGSKGPGVSFERYILASYFEDIIQIANIHLQRMTGSRYRLKRRADKTRGGSSGLDMEVIDSYTGTQRSVSTLSGGEGFKASLALALGLSDVVQIYAGGVSIDTMFIDEGFGSLDEKSLDSAVETLLSLESSGRMVGIISHVSQLQGAIQTKLLVRYSPTGSTAGFYGIVD